MTIEQLGDAVLHLSPEDLDKFAEWFEEFLADQLDKQIEPISWQVGLTEPASRRTKPS